MDANFIEAKGLIEANKVDMKTYRLLEDMSAKMCEFVGEPYFLFVKRQKVVKVGK